VPIRISVGAASAELSPSFGDSVLSELHDSANTFVPLRDGTSSQTLKLATVGKFPISD
jgi:hypothetical protein